MANEKSSHYHVVHAAFAVVGILILIKIVDALVGLRVDIEDESTGLVFVSKNRLKVDRSLFLAAILALICDCIIA